MKRHAGSGSFGKGVLAYAWVAMSTVLLLAWLFRLQVLGSDEWELRAESNRVRQLPVANPRGNIFDRDGRVLADNTAGYAIVVLPSGLAALETTLRRLSPHLNLTESRIERFMASARTYGPQPIVIDTDADFGMASAIEERIEEFPEVYVQTRPRRRYPGGRATGHLVGYVGQVSAAELDSPEFPESRYRPGMIVGKEGIERQYEISLQGNEGYRYVEIDARGRIVGEFATSRQKTGIPGEDLHLNIHLGLQERIAEMFPESLSGAVVALDVEDGGVLALYSSPGYDPNDFVGGIDSAAWARLTGDSRQPLYHRAVLGRYAPASTWKVAAAAIALDLGLVDVEEYMPVPCTGAVTLAGDRRRCWYEEGHGWSTLPEAIGESCNVYFYQLGMLIGLDRLIQSANGIGFRARCGIDLPLEHEGVFPESRDYWKRTFGYDARETEVLSLVIGQGPNSQTPLKVAQFYLALARDGSAPPPSLVRGAPREGGWALDIGDDELATLRLGLSQTTAPGGTAHFGTALEHWHVIGKTGTGQHVASATGDARDHAWFAGMAGPFGGPPEIVVVVLVEYGDTGSGTAAPLMAKAADYYLRAKHGLPLGDLQTYRDYLEAGVHPDWYWERMRNGGWDVRDE